MFGKMIAGCMKRSVWIYHVNMGTCTGCQESLTKFLGPWYDAQKFGFEYADSICQADILVVMGCVTEAAREKTEELFEQMEEPKCLVVLGDCLTEGSEGTPEAEDNWTDVSISGCPAEPADVLKGLQEAAEILRKKYLRLIGIEETEVPEETEKLQNAEEGLNAEEMTEEFGEDSVEETEEEYGIMLTGNCIYCGLCAKNCPEGAITVDRKEQIWAVDHELCTGCLTCIGKCPRKILIWKEPEEEPASEDHDAAEEDKIIEEENIVTKEDKVTEE